MGKKQRYRVFFETAGLLVGDEEADNSREAGQLLLDRFSFGSELRVSLTVWVKETESKVIDAYRARRNESTGRYELEADAVPLDKEQMNHARERIRRHERNVVESAKELLRRRSAN